MVPGNRGAWVFWRTEGDRAEFITVSLWESRAAIEGFAGHDIERDLTVRHYEVTGAG